MVPNGDAPSVVSGLPSCAPRPAGGEDAGHNFGLMPDAFAEVHALRLLGHGFTYIAEYLGIGRSTAIERARRAKMHLAGIRRANEPWDQSKLSLFERGDLTPCKRCGLRGEHECLPDRADAFLGNREEPNF